MLVIDGHNLIPKIPGLSLSEVDDEERLLALLKAYAAAKRKQIEVFFDGAPPGHAGQRDYGRVRAHFVPLGRKADDAILDYLRSLGKAARNATVITSDHQVQNNAREKLAQVIPSEKFAAELVALRDQPPKGRAKPGTAPAESGLPAPQVDEWLKMFQIDPALAEKPIEMLPKEKKPGPPGKKKPRSHHGFEKKG